ncbi:MAG: TatD family hydrolase [Acidobacteria bacterium]|nr:TatD family hydrolase [Acidobacteriota bacterium]
MTLADTHCHLELAEFDADRDDVLRRAREAGVETILAINTATRLEELDRAIRLAEKYEGVRATVGVQPHDAHKAGEDVYARLQELASHPKVVAVGETGLEYHYDVAPREAQREAFVRQLRIAGQAGKPVIVHTREAWDDTFALLEEHWRPFALSGIMHCFTGGAREAERCLEMGFYLSFSGILTYKSAEAIREAARLAPAERILVETDAPLLAPAPLRGRRNEPAFVVHTARRLAGVRGESLEQVARAVSGNFARLCLLPAQTSG